MAASPMPFILHVDGHGSRNAAMQCGVPKPPPVGEDEDFVREVSLARVAAVRQLLEQDESKCTVPVLANAADKAEDDLRAARGVPYPEPPQAPLLTESEAWKCLRCLLYLGNPTRSHSTNPLDIYGNAQAKRYLRTQYRRRWLEMKWGIYQGLLLPGTQLDMSAGTLRMFTLLWMCQWAWPTQGDGPTKILVASWLKALVPHQPIRLSNMPIPLSRIGRAEFMLPDRASLKEKLKCIDPSEIILKDEKLREQKQLRAARAAKRLKKADEDTDDSSAADSASSSGGSSE